MARFFITGTPMDIMVLSGEDGRHIARSLRMRPGERLTLCDGNGTDYLCEITSIQRDEMVQVQVLEKKPSVGEPSVKVTLYQGLPKSDKMEWITQKAVESGVTRIVPMMTERCISRPDARALDKKGERWQKIAEEAAKQSGRGIIPQVAPLVDFKEAMLQAVRQGPVIFLYEGGGVSLRELIREDMENVSIFIGPEGGFAEEELAMAQYYHAHVGSMGPRIFRTETAATAALAAIMVLTGNM